MHLAWQRRFWWIETWGTLMEIAIPCLVYRKVSAVRFVVDFENVASLFCSCWVISIYVASLCFVSLFCCAVNVFCHWHESWRVNLSPRRFSASKSVSVIPPWVYALCTGKTSLCHENLLSAKQSKQWGVWCLSWFSVVCGVWSGIASTFQIETAFQYRW